ncbi:MAG: hypothetical protein HC831_04880, partial [Chloroflexia bacterium]|nr:hypothetical protein [Chloroflexia bacterium]
MLLIASIILFVVFAYFGITFLYEKEKRAFFAAFVSGVTIAAPLFFVWVIFPNDTILQISFILAYLIV